jgi:thiamine biosynthesis protein ThiS
MRVFYSGKELKAGYRKGMSVEGLLKSLGINPETVLVKVNDEIVPDDCMLDKEDNIEVLRVVSGG